MRRYSPCVLAAISVGISVSEKHYGTAAGTFTFFVLMWIESLVEELELSKPDSGRKP
jgi:hypothetical protein